MVVMDRGLCVLEGLVSMVEKGVFGSALIKKRRCQPKGVPEEDIIWHMKNKKVGDLDAVPGSIRGKSYRIMDIKDTNYVMLTMKTYGKLENLEGSDTHRRYKGAGGKLVTK